MVVRSREVRCSPQAAAGRDGGFAHRCRLLLRSSVVACVCARRAERRRRSHGRHRACARAVVAAIRPVVFDRAAPPLALWRPRQAPGAPGERTGGAGRLGRRAAGGCFCGNTAASSGTRRGALRGSFYRHRCCLCRRSCICAVPRLEAAPSSRHASGDAPGGSAVIWDGRFVKASMGDAVVTTLLGIARFAVDAQVLHRSCTRADSRPR